MSRDLSSSASAEALLRFYAEAGVDVALSDEAVDRFALTRARSEAAARARVARAEIEAEADAAEALARSAPASAEPQAPERPSVFGAAVVPSDAVVMAAREAAAGAETLDDLRETLARFEGCNLRLTATRLVFADGNPQARLMLVGEAPGQEEDLQGLPFVGRSGQLLDKMLAAIGLDRTSAYIANVIPWRPPGNRTPTPLETEICRPFIERQIALVDPDVLVLLGGASAKQILQTQEGILKLRGQWRDYHTGDRAIRAMATLHPAYLLRQPLQKRLAWRDLLAVKAALAAPND
jgi:uracil-DNA glycosylase family 4